MLCPPAVRLPRSASSRRRQRAEPTGPRWLARESAHDLGRCRRQSASGFCRRSSSSTRRQVHALTTRAISRDHLVTAAPRVGVRLRRRRRRAEHHRASAEPPERHREIARVIADALFLLVGRVVLLIDDDQAGVVQRCEDRRARTDHHARSRRSARPSSPSSARRRSARYGASPASVPKRCAKRPHDLIGQRDFRHQHDHASLGRQRLGGEPQVDLGLAASRHAPQQKSLEAPLADRRRDLGDDGGSVPKLASSAMRWRSRDGARDTRLRVRRRNDLRASPRARPGRAEQRGRTARAGDRGRRADSPSAPFARESLDDRALVAAARDRAAGTASASPTGVGCRDGGRECRRAAQHSRLRRNRLSAASTASASASSMQLARCHRSFRQRFEDSAVERGEGRGCERRGFRGGVKAPLRFDSRRRRHHAAIGLGQRCHVVGRHEVDQFEMRTIKQRSPVEQFEYGARRAAARVEIVADLEHHRGDPSRSQRYQHAMPAVRRSARAAGTQ